MNLTVLLVLFLLQQNVSSERILAVTLLPAYTHQKLYQPLWKELAVRGHDIVVITPDPTNETHPHYKEVTISESYAPMMEMLKEIIQSSIVKIIWDNLWYTKLTTLTEYQLKLHQVQDLINNEKEHFDLIIIENFLSPAFGLQYRFKCPMIAVYTMDSPGISHAMMGNMHHSILHPSSALPFQTNLSFPQRLTVKFVELMEKYMYYSSLKMITKSARTIFGDDMPPIDEIYENTDMLFNNVNPIISGVRAVSPSTISIAGIHIKPEEPLPKPLQKFLDSAKKGAIYFSLGVVREYTLEQRQIIIETLKQLPYKIIWKYEDDHLLDKPDNVMIMKWAPQQDILRHKNIKLFISQGGTLSLIESVNFEVPSIVIPFSFDQLGNAARVQSNGAGIIVDIKSFNVNDFKEAILEVMENPKYQENLKKIGRQINDVLVKPLENAVWWTEYVLRHRGAQHLKGPRIPWYQFFYIDIGLTVTALFFVFSLITYRIIMLSLRRICCQTKVGDLKLKKS